MTAPENTELSERELEILRLVATGASNKEIAVQLYISANTVKVHLRNIFTKIGAASRTEAAMYAVRIGLVQGVSGQAPGEAFSQGALAAGDQATISTEGAPSRRIWPRWATPVLVILVIGLAGLGFAIGRGSTPEITPQPTTFAPLTAPNYPRWHTLATLPTARRGLALVAYENQLYAIGGETEEGVTSALDLYDQVNDTWTSLSAKPTAVGDVAAAVINGLIYIPGGRTGPDPSQLTDRLEIYDPALDQWRTGAALPLALSGYSLAAFEGRMYLFGGWNGESYLSSVFTYDPASDTWEERTAMNAARAFSGAAVAGSKIYVIGGMAGGTPLDVNAIYSPARDAGPGESPWESGFPMPDSRLGFQVATIADTIYILGGISQGGSDYGLIYIPQSDSWQSLEAPPQPLGASFGMASIGPQLFIVGGEIGSELSDQNLTYQALMTFSIPIIIK